MGSAPDLAGRVPDGWSACDDGYGAIVVHDRLEVRMRLIRQGIYRIGMSEAEYAAAQRLAPVPNITLSEVTPVVDVRFANDVLIGDRPITARLASELGVESNSDNASFPAMLTRDQAVLVTERLGGRLPLEAEWETGCRAGTRTLFFWGDQLRAPDRLEALLSWVIDDDEALEPNGLGLGRLFFGEWCDEPFTVSHAPDAEVVSGAFTIKGGGAHFWPWQDQEWVWCASAMRMPSTALFAEQRCAARLVLDLPAGPD